MVIEMAFGLIFMSCIACTIIGFGVVLLLAPVVCRAVYESAKELYEEWKFALEVKRHRASKQRDDVT